MTYSELLIAIDSGEVEKVTISADETSATVKLKDDKIEKNVNIPSMDSFIDYAEEYIKTEAIELEEESESIWITILSLITPFGLLIIFFLFIYFILVEIPCIFTSWT